MCDPRPHRFDQLLSLGKRVSSRPGPHTERVEEQMRGVASQRESLREAWEKRNKELKQCSELQVSGSTHPHTLTSLTTQS